MKQQGSIILASASPRRLHLLADVAGLRVEVRPSSVDESTFSERGCELPLALARAKYDDVARVLPVGSWGALIAADTVVMLSGDVLNKPHDVAQAREFLTRLSAQTHEVHTAVCVGIQGHAAQVWGCTTRVSFRSIGAQELEAYLASDEWRDKAGGYGIQGKAAAFISEIQGSYTNVVGLPLSQTLSCLVSLGVLEP